MSKNQELWQTRVNDYRVSNKSARQWCKENNIPVSTFKYWITKLNKEKSSSLNNPEFISIPTDSIEYRPSSSATIRFGKISVDILDGCQPEMIRTILQALNLYV